MKMVKTTGTGVRRGIFWTICVGSFLILVILITYYSGYRLNWRTGKFFQMGSIAIDVSPKDSQIFLNGQLLSKTTPALFNSIQPGEYQVSIQKAGFFSIEFNVNVRSSSTTVIQDVFLLPEIQATPTTPFSVQQSISTQQVAALQQVKDWPIWDIEGKQIMAVTAGSNHSLRLVEGEQITFIANDVNDAAIQENLDQLVFIESGTAWIRYLNEGTPVSFILSRQSTPFQQILLLPEKQAVILVDQQTIQLVVIGPQQSIYTSVVTQGTKIQNVSLSSSGDTIYFQDGDDWFERRLQTN